MWNERYSGTDFFYGTQANDFIVQHSSKLKDHSTILCLAEGEGRNAHYLASLGHQVSAMDQSQVGLDKARQRANQAGLNIQWICADLNDFDLGKQKWDAIICVFGHLPPQLQSQVLAKIPEALKAGGIFMAEYYHPDQISYGTGGPKDPTWMLRCQDLEHKLGPALGKIVHQAELEREVLEGKGHTGKAKVSQWISQKQ